MSSNYSPSNDACSINISVINNTSHAFSQADIWRHHGKTVNNPVSSILGNSPETLIATFGKESGYGPLGLLKYTSDDGTALIIYYNNPEVGETTSSTAETNQWFYAILQPPSGKGTSYYLDVSGFTMNLNGSGESEEVMNPVITINLFT